MGRKHGFSFSWRRASGLSAAKGRLSRKIGVPLTRRRQKFGRMGCVPMIALALIAGIAADSKRYKIEILEQKGITLVDLTFDRRPAMAALERMMRLETLTVSKKHPDLLIMTTAWMVGNNDDMLPIGDGSDHIVYEPKLKKVMTYKERSEWLAKQKK